MSVLSGGLSDEYWAATRPDEVAVLEVFADRMRRELAANSAKGDRPGWIAETPRSLLAEVQHHYVKLHACVVEYDRASSMFGEPRALPWCGEDLDELRDRIAEFAADVANMAMMVADRCGVLQVPGASVGDPSR